MGTCIKRHRGFWTCVWILECLVVSDAWVMSSLARRCHAASSQSDAPSRWMWREMMCIFAVNFHRSWWHSHSHCPSILAPLARHTSPWWDYMICLSWEWWPIGDIRQAIVRYWRCQLRILKSENCTERENRKCWIKIEAVRSTVLYSLTRIEGWIHVGVNASNFKPKVTIKLRLFHGIQVRCGIDCVANRIYF